MTTILPSPPPHLLSSLPFFFHPFIQPASLSSSSFLYNSNPPTRFRLGLCLFFLFVQIPSSTFSFLWSSSLSSPSSLSLSPVPVIFIPTSVLCPLLPPSRSHLKPLSPLFILHSQRSRTRTDVSAAKIRLASIAKPAPLILNPSKSPLRRTVTNDSYNRRAPADGPAVSLSHEKKRRGWVQGSLNERHQGCASWFIKSNFSHTTDARTNLCHL